MSQFCITNPIVRAPRGQLSRYPTILPESQFSTHCVENFRDQILNAPRSEFSRANFNLLLHTGSRHWLRLPTEEELAREIQREREIIEREQRLAKGVKQDD